MLSYSDLGSDMVHFKGIQEYLQNKMKFHRTWLKP